MMTPAQQIALWADQIRDMAALGLHYANNTYDVERYHALQSLAIEMLAFAAGEPLERIEPLRAPIFARPTPLSTGDAAIIDADGRILLIQRADNSCWAMPGGAFAVGETPAEGAVREALEETGVACEPTALVGVFDSRRCGSITRHHLYHFVFLCRPLPVPPVPPTHAHEVLDARWFAEAELPANIDPGHVTRIPVAYAVWRGERPAFFDR
jgi:ADP-ribose pyrophosphatase YjhB (NUDIX family)